MNNNNTAGLKLIRVEFSINSNTKDLQAIGVTKLIKASHSNIEVKGQQVHPESNQTKIRLHYTMTFKYEAFDESIVSTLKELNEQLTDRNNKVLISFVTEYNMNNISVDDINE